MPADFWVWRRDLSSSALQPTLGRSSLDQRARLWGAARRETVAAERRHTLASGASHWLVSHTCEALEGRHRGHNRQSLLRSCAEPLRSCGSVLLDMPPLRGLRLQRRLSRDLRPWLKYAAAP